KYNINEIIEKNFNSRNKNIILRWLNILFENEFIHLENNNCYLRKVVNKNNIDRYYEDAKNLWDWKLGDPLSIDYINQNIKYLQELFDGKKKCNSILFPGGDLKYAKALYKNNMVYRYINDLVAITISDYVKKYSSGINKIKILEIGAGIGATTDSVLKRLIDENLIDEVLYKYTDISNFFIQCAKSKYENVVSNIEYEKIDIDKDMEKLGKETFDIVIAVGVLNNSGKLNTVLREIYNTVKKDSLILIAEPVKEPPEMLVSQVFMMTKPTDIRLEKNRTFLNRLEWLDLLKDTFDKKQILTYPKNTHALYEFGQQLFVVKI
ncbi:class I SAM-dependent methyltransferase, partial [Enterococcus faecalis]|nr:class I SAM-dependent methyltransferase [Enterococcus faecalis]